MTIDYSLMFVTDERVVEDEPFLEILRDALEGGVSMVQLREKKATERFVYERARKVRILCHEYDVPFIINDRVDIALSVNADGVHVGQDDMPAPVVRELMGSNKIIGLSVSCESALREAENKDVDYLGIGPVFATATKCENIAEPLGLEGLAAMRACSTKPIVAIGSINCANAQSVIQVGVQGLAVVSEISQATSPLVKTEILRRIIWKTGINT